MNFWASGPRPVQTEAEAFWYLHLSSEQQAAYERFQVHLTELDALLDGHDDKWTLLRFLKARQWDVEKAATMYQHMAKWRTDNKTDELARSFEFPELDKVHPVSSVAIGIYGGDAPQIYPHFYHKTDRFGRPVYIELLGQTDPAKLLEVMTLEGLLSYHICEWEELKSHILPRCSVVAARPIITKSVVLDLKGVSLKNFGSAAQRILRTVAAVDQDYYPEHLGQMFIINTPTIFRAIWAVVNPLLEDRTRRKIVILGADFLPTLTQLIPEENLPEILGGKSKVADLTKSEGPWADVAITKQASEPVLLAADAAVGAAVDGLQGLLLAPKAGGAAIAAMSSDPVH